MHCSGGSESGTRYLTICSMISDGTGRRKGASPSFGEVDDEKDMVAGRYCRCDSTDSIISGMCTGSASKCYLSTTGIKKECFPYII